MADDPNVSVKTPSGGNAEVPSSVVDAAPGDAPSYTDTGNGANPVSVTANRLNQKIAKRSYPGVISAIAASEYRETSKDGSQVTRIKSLLEIMKSLQDGTYTKLVEGGKYQTELDNLIDKVPAGNEGIQAKLSDPTEGISKSALSTFRNIVAQETRSAYASIGVNTNGNNYTSLVNAGVTKLPELEQQEKVSRGATAPLAPLTRTTSLMNLLDDLETGKSTANVNPSVWTGMLNRAGVQSGGFEQGANDMGNTIQPGTTLPPVVQRAVQRVTVQAIQTHMLDLAGKNPDPDFVQDVKSANSAKALKAVTLPSHLHAMAGTDGYNLSNVTTFGSFFQQLDKQSVKTKSGQLGIPGEEVKVPARPTANGSGQQFFDAFKQQWQTNSAYRDEVAATLNSAGVDSTAIGSKAANYAQAANALQKVMEQTPQGENPWAYLKAQPTISATTLHSDPGYALVLAEATKIGAKLTNDQINRLAQVYGGSTSTGNTDAMDQAIASMYRYDPNADTQPGSFAATALQNIQQTFGSYGISLTNSQAGSYVQSLLNKGGADLTSIYSAGDAATAYATDMAKQAATSLFPTLAPVINSGQPLTGSGGMLTPYLSQYAQMLGVDPDTVNLTPQLIKLMAADSTGTSKSVGSGTEGAGTALQSGKGESGAPTAQAGLKSLDQFQAAIMQDPSTGWGSSPSAHEAYANMSNTLLSTMGFAPPQGAQVPGSPNTSNLAGGGV